MILDREGDLVVTDEPPDRNIRIDVGGMLLVPTEEEREARQTQMETLRHRARGQPTT